MTGPTDAGGGSNDAGGSSTDAGAGPVDAGSTFMLPVATLVSGACDTLTSAAVLLSSIDGGTDIDELASAVTALPFAFSLLGEPMTHFAAVTNGYLQLSTAATFTPVVQAFPGAIPSNFAPNGIIAPLWCDLTQPATGYASLSTQVFGSAPARHFTAEWSNLTFYLGDGNNRVTFQAKLFEGTNAIEFHYCALDTNGETTQYEHGAGAVVGIEGSDGGAGVVSSSMQAILRTDAGIHFE